DCESGHGREVGAGGASGEEDGVRIDAVVVSVRAGPGDDSLDVDEVFGETLGGNCAELIVGADACPASACPGVQQRPPLPPFSAPAEGAAVEVDECGWVHRVAAMAIDVEKVADALLAVWDVRNPLDVKAPQRDRDEEDPQPRQAPAQSAGELRVDRFSPSNAE